MPMPAPAVPEAPSPVARKRGAGRVIGLLIALATFGVYVAYLAGYGWLTSIEGELKAPDLGTVDDTVVVVRVEQLHTVANRLDVKVLVMPDESMIDKEFGVLNTDMAVRLYPQSDLGDLQYPAGKLPAQVATTIEAHGNAGKWPFDTYTTDTIQAEVLVGTGDGRGYLPARVEVTGSLEGWDVSLRRTGEASQSSDRPDDVVLTLRRAKGPLVFDLGICLVLITLPTLALFVAIQMFRGRRKFLPPFVTWYAAMLFAVVPIRNLLPGAPPAGSWIDQTVVLWVVVGLVVAMVLFIVTWYRRSD
jgi:hypothetical protein